MLIRVVFVTCDLWLLFTHGLAWIWPTSKRGVISICSKFHLMKFQLHNKLLPTGSALIHGYILLSNRANIISFTWLPHLLGVILPCLEEAVILTWTGYLFGSGQMDQILFRCPKNFIQWEGQLSRAKMWTVKVSIAIDFCDRSTYNAMEILYSLEVSESNFKGWCCYAS